MSQGTRECAIEIECADPNPGLVPLGQDAKDPRFRRMRR
jgi:hypothetical protein